MTRPSLRYFQAALVLTIMAGFSGSAFSQQASTVALPNAPDFLMASAQPGTADPAAAAADGGYSTSAVDSEGQTNATPPPGTPHTDGQTKRILGIIPNFRAVSANVKLPPQTVKDKFVTASQDSFDYSSVLIPALLAGYNQAENNTPEFHQGAAGYGRYFWHSFVDQTSENYFVEFIVPAATHEDTRYYTMGSGGFRKRAVYALTRAVITRNDAGKEVFNASEVIGSGMSAGLSTTYYPSKERSFGNTGGQWGLDIGIDAATFVFKEFWPDINHHLFHGSTPYAD